MARRGSWWVALAAALALALTACAGRYTVEKSDAPAAGGQANVTVNSVAGAGEPADASFYIPTDAPTGVPDAAPMDVPDAAPYAYGEPGQGVCLVPSDIDITDAGTAPGCFQEPVPENCPRKSCMRLCPVDNYAIGCYLAPAPRASLGCTPRWYDATSAHNDYCCPCLHEP